MHADQIDITPDVVAALVAAQFPQWRSHPVRPVASHGTVNALFRLGEEIVLRFPLQPSLGAGLHDELVREQDNERRIAALTSLAVPEPLALGEPGEGYPGPWTAYRWIPGEAVSTQNVHDWDLFARDLAGFAGALHRRDTGGRTWNGRGRGGPLHRVAVGRSASTGFPPDVDLVVYTVVVLAAPACLSSVEALRQCANPESARTFPKAQHACRGFTRCGRGGKGPL
jgi:aminoglycoside phosphotransferase (APT) family kinase protein